MTSSTRGFFLFVVHKAEASFQGLVRGVGMFVRDLCITILRTVITLSVVGVCTMLILRYLGFPMPGPAELIDKFGEVGRLSRILS